MSEVREFLDRFIKACPAQRLSSRLVRETWWNSYYDEALVFRKELVSITNAELLNFLDRFVMACEDNEDPGKSEEWWVSSYNAAHELGRFSSGQRALSLTGLKRAANRGKHPTTPEGAVTTNVNAICTSCVKEYVRSLDSEVSTCPHCDETQVTDAEVVEPGLYRHYKGGMYRVLFTAQDSTNGRDLELVVVYLSCKHGTLNTRRQSEFVERVQVDDTDTHHWPRRFEKVQS